MDGEPNSDFHRGTRHYPCNESSHTNIFITGVQALTIAQADAENVYKELARYRIQIVLEDDGWHVDYQLKDERLCGGGPHYVIDAVSGAIISKRYEQ